MPTNKNNANTKEHRMNYSILLLFVLSLSLSLTAAFLLLSIRKNFMQGQSFRIEFLDRIEATRFGKMLRKHNLDPQELVHTQPLAGIENQLRNCRDCLKTTECERVLEKPVVSEYELAFCPNHLAISQQN